MHVSVSVIIIIIIILNCQKTASAHFVSHIGNSRLYLLYAQSALRGCI